ncbi:hypothetical protein CEB3_c25490 [Peptococcaceae bacterium CEB3]|nr:hypothetical protein CEB3_c25490 [Peptococcaceae bacterium CEB3]
MFSAETDLWAVAAKQYLYKLKSHSGFALGFVATQIIALFSGGIGGFSSSGSNVMVTVTRYTSAVPFIYTSIWIFVLALTLTGRSDEKKDFSLVANRTSNHLANIGVLLSAWLYGGVGTTLLMGLQRWYLYFSSEQGEVIANGFYLTGRSLALALAAILLYLLLLTAASYLIGVLIRISYLFTVLLPAVLFAWARLNGNALQRIGTFFLREPSLSLFALKVLTAALVLFGFSVLISSRLEVNG